jgi:hypothetical protein
MTMIANKRHRAFYGSHTIHIQSITLSEQECLAVFTDFGEFLVLMSERGLFLEKTEGTYISFFFENKD